MVPIGLTPSTGDGVTTVFTAAELVSNEMLFADRVLQIPTTDYTSATVGGVSVYTFTTAPVTGALLTLFGAGQIVATANSITSAGFSTAKTIINRTAVQLGLQSLTDPVGSTDPNFVLLLELLNDAGANLLSQHEWAHLIQEFTITTANGATFYALPADFDRAVDDSEWNRSTRLPMIGPLRGQEVQYIKARLSGVLVQVAYRIQGNTITFPTAPANAQTLAAEYVSNYWVWGATASAPSTNSVTANGDIVLYDAELVIAALRLAYLETKGFDTSQAQRKYEDKLQAAIGKNVGSRILNMGGIGINADHLIDAQNLPITGYAQ